MLSWDDPVPMTTALGPLPQVRMPQPSPAVPPLAERHPVTPDELAIAPQPAVRVATSQAALSDRRVRVEDKRIINGASDVNQLVPFKY